MASFCALKRKLCRWNSYGETLFGFGIKIVTKYCNIFTPKNSSCLGYQDFNRILHSLHKLWRVSSPTQQNLSILRLFYSHKMSPRSCPADSVGQSNQAHRLYQITDSCRLCGMLQREKFQNLATYCYVSFRERWTCCKFSKVGVCIFAAGVRMLCVVY